MSFTSDTKKELTTVETGKKCCQLALISGFLRFAGSITLTGGRMGLKVSTDSPAVARLMLSLIKEYFGAKSSLSMEEAPIRRGHSYILNITPEMNADAILRETGILGVREGSNYITDGLNAEIIRKRCCKKAALRGIFLAAGSVSDPAKGYHLEIICDSEYMAFDVKKLVNGFGLRSKVAPRRNKFIVYIKDGEQIADFMSVIGASGQVLSYQNTRVTKELLNTANRISNCESANLDKTVNAAQKQIADIRCIASLKTLDYLPDKLRRTAELRLQNPELSLVDLAELFDPPIGKSGLNHRLQKISEIAEKLRSETLSTETGHGPQNRPA